MKKANIIISIGRQLGSGGKKIASILSEKFSAKLYDKELLDLAAKESGFGKRFFEQNDEKTGLIRSIFYGYSHFIGNSGYYNNSFSQETLFQFQSEAIVKVANEGNCVFVGRCADYVLRNNPNLFSIFITANQEDRIRRIMKRLDCDENKANTILNKGDDIRSSYYNYYTSKIWGASSSYDICINSSILGIEETADIITNMVIRKMEHNNII